MQEGCKVLGLRQAMEVRHTLGQGERLITFLQGLVRIAKQLQGPGCIGEATHAGISPVKESERTVLLRVVERYPMLQVSARRDELAKPDQRIPQHSMGLYEEHGVLQGLGEREQLFGQPPRRPQLRPRFVESPQAPQG